jgi:SOS response regulatory protein OraA/RecX
MPTVTALRPARPGHVLAELDGTRWRTLPLDAVARAGLTVGTELDRERARTLRRELRRSEAVSLGARTLARRERSEQRVREALERRGFSGGVGEEAVGALRRVGAVDDERFASTRAAARAERGFGDAAIAYELDREGVARELVQAALAALEPEARRAERLADRRGRDLRTARWLARRGFAPDSIEAAIPTVAATGEAELG